MARLVGKTRPASLTWLFALLVAGAAAAIAYGLVTVGIAAQLLARV
jgi:hypothetical protein